MTTTIKEKVEELIKDKIKEPIQDDLMLAGEDHVRAKLQIQGRSFNDLDNDYLAELIAETTMQIAVSYESVSLLESLSMIL